MIETILLGASVIVATFAWQAASKANAQIKALQTELKNLDNHFPVIKDSLTAMKTSVIASEIAQKSMIGHVSGINLRLDEAEKNLTQLILNMPIHKKQIKGAATGPRRSHTPEEKKRMSDRAKARWARLKAVMLPTDSLPVETK